MFARLVASVSTRTYPICDKKSLLFANDASVKISSCKDSLFSLTKRNPLAAFSICY